MSMREICCLGGPVKFDVLTHRCHPLRCHGAASYVRYVAVCPCPPFKDPRHAPAKEAKIMPPTRSNVLPCPLPLSRVESKNRLSRPFFQK